MAWPEDPSLDWPNVIQPGDVVRSRDGKWIGVVVPVVNSAETGDPPWWELHVDGALDGVPQGVGVWRPWTAVVSDDPELGDEASRLGLRGLRGLGDA